jgi:coproporphyrinogen III oxidase-like Fe-S oxidoreductase
MLQLRLVKGLNTDKFREIFGCSFERMFAKYLPAYIQNGFMVKHGKNYAFTVKGMYVSNYILSTMLDFDSDISYGIANGSDR